MGGRQQAEVSGVTASSGRRTIMPEGAAGEAAEAKQQRNKSHGSLAGLGCGGG